MEAESIIKNIEEDSENISQMSYSEKIGKIYIQDEGKIWDNKIPYFAVGIFLFQILREMKVRVVWILEEHTQ